MTSVQSEKRHQFIFDESSSNWFAEEIAVYHCKFQKEAFEDRLFSSFGIKFPESLERAVSKRRAEFLAGRYCVSQLLKEFDVYNYDLEIGKNRAPTWPDNILGSISHCGTQAIAIATRNPAIFGVGVDIEDKVSKETATTTQRQIICEDELPLLSTDNDTLTQAFTIFFSIKESFFKAAYRSVGEYFEFDAVSIVSIDYQTSTLIFRVNYFLCKSLTKGMLIKGFFHLLPDKKIATLVILKK